MIPSVDHEFASLFADVHDSAPAAPPCASAVVRYDCATARYRRRSPLAQSFPEGGRSDAAERDRRQKPRHLCRGFAGGRYWDRTSDLFRVREARYRCANRPSLSRFCFRLEVEMGFEPVYTALQAAASPLGQSTASAKPQYIGLSTMSSRPFDQAVASSGRRDSNSRPSPWQGDALPLRHVRIARISACFETVAILQSIFKLTRLCFVFRACRPKSCGARLCTAHFGRLVSSLAAGTRHATGDWRSW